MNSKSTRQSVSPARTRAYEVLRRVETESAYASVLLAAHDDPELSREDRALAQEIVLGVIRWQRALDYFVERYSGRSIERLDLPVLIGLRIGLYQLRFLERIPQSAAVNESVNLVKRARAASAAGLVNAVLRKAATHLREEAGKDTSDPFERASIALSHPRWMLERWEAMLGDGQTRQLALANNFPQVTAFRVNTLRATSDEVLLNLNAQGVTTRASQIAPGAFVIETGPAGIVSEAARGGLIYVQDEGSQLVSILLEPRPGHRVLDLCAAPGSKSSHIATLAQDKAWVVACDIHPRRLNTLRASCDRLDLESVNALALDATQALPFDGSQRFDRVLVDAPCSGTGTLRGNPEIKWRLSPDDVTRLAELQLRLLECAASWVATGGRLVYSTCSIEPEENEEVIRKFLEGSALFSVLEPNACADVITAEGFVRTFPHRHGADGFFAAVLEKTV